MRLFRTIRNLFKARYGTFTEEEFGNLCKVYGNVNGLFDRNRRKDVEKVLKVFLAYHTPTSTQLNELYGYGDTLRWLYLEAIPDNRALTDDEQMYLAGLMEFGPTHHFPQAINNRALVHLFGSGNVKRIAAYAKDFTLPERFELEIIERYGKQKPYCNRHRFGKCDYQDVLKAYLSSYAHPKCQSEEVQNKLLEVVDDEDMWVALCSNQNMDDNVLSEHTIRELIDRKYRKALRALLMHSFIPSADLRSHLLAKLPKLKWELEISKIRRALRKLEKQTNVFWGVEAPNYKEAKIIEECLTAANQLAYIEQNVLTRLSSGRATPYFCAWATDEYPHLGEDAYKCLRGFAENYLQENKN